MSLAGKVALVTGSTSGIGLATAEALAKVGSNLVIHGLVTQNEGEALAQNIAHKYGVKTIFSDANLAHEEEIAHLFETSVAKLGAVDILVNNAGIQHTDNVENFPVAKWDLIIAVNLSSAFHTTRLALGHMQAQQWGRIINIASVHGLVGSVNKSAYVAAKHGLVGLTKVTALENANNGITVNAICPGWVETPLINQQIEDITSHENISFEQAKVRLVTAKQPRSEMAAPQQIGELVCFIASDAASGITGTTLPIDGGWTAQ